MSSLAYLLHAHRIHLHRRGGVMKRVNLIKRRRYQKGLKFEQVFPKKDRLCACGCERTLAGRRTKWFSDTCRDNAYVIFAVLKGDNRVIREALYQRQRGQCQSCGTVTDEWHADHIRPVSQGGGACSIENFQTLCLDCHAYKTHKLPHRSVISRHASSAFL